MPSSFFDTSALGKNYHVEVGTEEVERLLALPEGRNFISRLSIVEMQSVFARKVRMNVITDADFQLVRRRFLTDVAQRQLRVVRMTSFHYQEAERLIGQHSRERSLRTLDALQLAVALDVQRRTGLDHFVCADRNLCAVAMVVGLPVTNPEDLSPQAD